MFKQTEKKMNEVWEDVFNQGVMNSGRENRKMQIPWGILRLHISKEQQECQCSQKGRR